jgi:hypothetical protein
MFAPFGNGKKLKQQFVPQFETVFYVHKFAAGRCKLQSSNRLTPVLKPSGFSVCN